MGIRLYLTEGEARALCDGDVPASVKVKIGLKLVTKGARVIPGQLDLIEEIEREEQANAAR